MPYTLKLENAYKKYTVDQDKVLPPAETVKRFKNMLSKVDLDILESTFRIDNGRLNIPVYFSVCGKDAHQVIGTKKQMGKGGSPSQAEASAVMELAERFSFFSFSKNPKNFLKATYSDVTSASIPYELVAKSVHDDSEEALRAKRLFETIPMRWAEGYNLTRKESVLAPFDWFFAINEFNGPSAGNCVEEALCQGICEVVERHASSLVSRKQLRAPLINFETADDPTVIEMLAKYKNAGIKLFASDFSLDTGIATVGVLAYDPSTFPNRSEIVWTAGTTPDPRKSLSRALTEVAQLAGDFNTGSNYVASGLPKFTDISEASFITTPGKTVELMDLPDLSDENIKQEVLNLVSVLGERDMEVIEIETTHPLLKIPAFYTIIPGAHFRERAAGTSVGMFSTKLIAEKFPPAEAIDRLEQAEKILPNKYYIKFYMGTCRLAMGDPRNALSEFQTAMNLSPAPEDIPSIYSYTGICLKELEQYHDALKMLEKGARIDRERTDIFNLMGFCHFKMKNHEAAIECFENVLKLNPASAIDYANIASNYREMGQKEKAIRYYRIALELDPSIDFARKNLDKLTAE